LSTYRYFDKKNSGMDVEGCLEDLKNAPNRSVILLHACAHNPTGVDPTAEVWKKISKICAEKEHICYFDSAYQV
jgi:aspartate aminotransferase, mitochondrial